jgi:hypothetical protein
MFGATGLRALKATTGLAALATTIALCAPSALAATAVNAGGTTRVLSVDAAGTTLGGRAPSVSRDGRYTAYERAGLINGGWGIVLHDSVNGTDTAVASVFSNVVVSADGRYVVYATYVDNDPTQLLVYRYNISTGNSTAMPAPDTGGATPYSISALTVSANGRYIAFLTGWQAPADQGLVRQDVFVTDATARATTSLEVGLLTTDVDHQVQQPAISGDGTKVAFTTSAGLTARDTNTHYDIYVHNMATGANELASRTVAGSTGNKQSTAPWISGDGRYVAFSSRSTNLAPGITDTTVTQAYLFDAQTTKTTLMTKTAAGVAGNGFAQALGISSTGRYVVFESAATDFGFPANPFGFTSWQIYRYDRVNDTIGLVSHAGGKSFPSNQGSGSLDAVISADGAHIAYSSTSRDLDRTAGITDGFGTLDLFAWSS